MTKHLQAAQYVLMKTPVASATTAQSAELNLSTYDADYVTFNVPVGVEANTNSTNVVVTIAKADDTNTYSTVQTALLDNTAAVVGVYHYRTNGRAKYVKVTVTPDTTTNGAVLIGGIVAIIDPGLKGQTNSTTGSVTIIS